MKIVCKKCGEKIILHMNSNVCTYFLDDSKEILSFDKINCNQVAEVSTRDKQAKNYLQHKKVPSQTKFFERFLKRITHNPSNKVVLDLGCGPGPTIKVLNNFGYKQITAIDFSYESLILNKRDNLNLNDVAWLRADLNDLIFGKDTVDVLIMADFIQHVGTFEDKINLLKNALSALKKDGYFYFSFFNFNIINYLKGDLRGSFSNQTIPYERLIPAEMNKIIDEYIEVELQYPMNITHKYSIDNFFGKFPLTSNFATMFAIEGLKK